MPSPATHAIGDACKQAGVVVSIGVNGRDGDTLYNTQLLMETERVGRRGATRRVRPAA